MRTCISLAACVLLLAGCGGGGSGAQAQPTGNACPPLVPVFGQPPWVVAPDMVTGTTWSMLRSYCPRDGGGSFVQFGSPNLAGEEKVGIALNGGLVDAAPGHENGDLDVSNLVDGKSGYTISFVPQGILVWPPDFFALGSPTNRWASIHLTPVACPPSVPNASECVRVNGGFVPVYH